MRKKAAEETVYMPVTSIFRKVTVQVDIKKFGYKTVPITEFEPKLQKIIKDYDGRTEVVNIYQNDKPFQITIIEDEKYIKDYIKKHKKLFEATITKTIIGADGKEKKPRKPRKKKET